MNRGAWRATVYERARSARPGSGSKVIKQENGENLEKSRKETSLKCLRKLMYLQWIKGFYLWLLTDRELQP